MFHRLPSSVPARRPPCGFVSLLTGALACSIAACVPEEPERPSAPAPNANTSLLAEPPGFETRGGGRPAEAVHADRVEERARRRAIGEHRDRSATGPPLDVRGTVVTAATGRPEVDCLVSLGNEQARTDPDGGFLLRDVPSDGQVRVRFRCRGVVERHTIEIPAGAGEVRLAEPVGIGPRREEEPSRPSAGASAAAQAFAAAGEDLARSLEQTTTSTTTGTPGAAAGSTASQRTATPASPGLAPAAAPELTTTGTGDGATPREAPATDVAAAAHRPAPEASTGRAAEPRGATQAPAPQATPEAPPAVPLTHQWSVDGGLDEEAVVAVLAERVFAIRNCYRAHFDGDIWRRGAVAAEWRVEPDGSVSGVTLGRSSFDDGEADACVARRLQRLTFPAAAEATQVQQRFVFALDLGPRAQLRPE